MDSGVYAIVNRENWRSYVGSTVNLYTRKQSHFQLLLANKHENSELQRDFNEFGEDCFSYEIIEYVDQTNLLSRERYWYDFGENLYNVTPPHNKIIISGDDLLRFWKFVNIEGKDDCWIWFGAKDKDGYGRMSFIRNKKKQMFRANRLAYFISNPDENTDLIVRHACNNPSCCNPKHLILGSYSDNAQDRVKSGRNYKGLNQEQIKIIRSTHLNLECVSSDETRKVLKEKHDIDIGKQTFLQIVNNKCYTNESYINTKQRFCHNRGKKKISDDIIQFLKDNHVFGKVGSVKLGRLVKEKFGLDLSEKYIQRIVL